MINIKKIFIVVTLKALFLISLNITFAQQSSAKKDEQPPEIQRLNEFSRIVSPRIREAEAKGNVLTVLEALRTLAGEYPTSKAVEHGMLMTFLMERTIELGNYADALRFADFDGQKFLDDASAAAELKDFRPVSAPEAIAEAAAARQIVIVNEAHHVPQHRALTVELLKKLKQKGFTHFAAETLFETDAKLNERGYPIKDTGAYINEPLYGDIVRTALKLGYKVVPYDVAFGGEPDARERGQAENLKKRIFEKDSQAKVLIHVGYGHNSEATRKNDTKLMTGYLKEFTGIDPLTVDQTAMSEHSAPEYERPLYRFVAAQKYFNQPLVFQNQAREFWTHQNSGRDVTVFHPRSRYTNGRPAWLALGGERKQYLLPKDVCQTEKNCLVRARFAAESADAVPVDQIEASTDTKTALMLPKGDFIIDVETVAGKSMKTWRVKR
jgi:hypothetical protein